MEKNEFFKRICDEYFKSLELSLDSLATMLKKVMIVSGELNIKKTLLEDGKTEIKFIDFDCPDYILKPSDDGSSMVEIELTEEDKKFFSTSAVILTLNVDNLGYIKTAESGVGGLFTPANKNLVLFIGSLINKKIV